MITLLLAWINAKYRCDYSLLFILTAIIDINLIAFISAMVG